MVGDDTTVQSDKIIRSVNMRKRLYQLDLQVFLQTFGRWWAIFRCEVLLHLVSDEATYNDF